MTAGFPVTLKDVRIEGSYAGIKFVGKLAHGKTHRLVEAVVQPRQILLIAQALLCCPDNMQHPGHAIYHLDRPSLPRPCPGKVWSTPPGPAKKRTKEPRGTTITELGGFCLGEEVTAKGRPGRIKSFTRIGPGPGAPEGKNRALVRFPLYKGGDAFEQFWDLSKLKHVRGSAETVQGFRVLRKKGKKA